MNHSVTTVKHSFTSLYFSITFSFFYTTNYIYITIHYSTWNQMEWVFYTFTNHLSQQIFCIPLLLGISCFIVILIITSAVIDQIFSLYFAPIFSPHH